MVGTIHMLQVFQGDLGPEMPLHVHCNSTSLLQNKVHIIESNKLAPELSAKCCK